MEQKLNLKTIGVIMIWIGIIIGIVYFYPSIKKAFSFSGKANKSASENAINAKLTADHYEYDFGDIKITGGKVKHNYQLKNEGPDDLMIEKVFTSCMCTQATLKTGDNKIYGPFGMSGHGGGSNLASIKLAPGEEVELEAEFDPMAHGPDAVGQLQRVIYVKTNSVKEPLGLSFTVNVTK